MITVNVLWRHTDGARFDQDYYAHQHVALLHELLGETLQGVDVDRGIGGMGPGTPPEFVAITRLHFASVEAFQAAFGEHGGRIRGDEVNFTDIEPLVQISEVAV